MVSPKRVARRPAPTRPLTTRPPASGGRIGPPRRGAEQIGAILALLLVGALVGVGIVGLVTGRGAEATVAPTSEPTEDPDALGTDVPEESAAVAAPLLEARMPKSVDGTTLTVQSAVDATTLSGGPDGRALNAAVVHLGKQASDLEIAYAYDESGAIDLTILGFRVDGVAVADVRDAVLTAWLAAGTPGVTTSTVTWSGATVTKLAYGDDGPDEYVLVLGDSVFVVETTDATLAQSAGSALLAPGGATGTPQPS